MKNLLFLIVLILSISCQNEVEEPVNIICHGFHLDDDLFELNDPFMVVPIQYSSSKKSSVLLGSVRYENADYNFSIVTSVSPLTNSFEIERHSFPLRSLDSTDYECILTYRKGVCEITWRNESKSLYLRNSIIEARSRDL